MVDYSWQIIGILGIICAGIYKIPQIVKLIKSRRGDDLSNKMFIIHIAAYGLLLIYQVGTYTDPILITYYVIGIFQTLILITLKYIYKKKNNKIDEIIENNQDRVSTLSQISSI